MKKVLKALSLKIQAAYKKDNAPIFFRELYVDHPRMEATAYGESTGCWDKGASSVDRLIAHIHSLMKLANAEHRKDFCEKDERGVFHLKALHKNTITRLTMNEFSLYTQAPLTIKQYQRLMQTLEEMAKELEPNVHIQLGSMALINEHGELVNVTTYIQGTDKALPAKIRTICKNTASTVDIDYGHQYKRMSQHDTVNAAPAFNSKGAVDAAGHTTYTGSVFEVTTAGGAKYTQAVDVCLDHLYGHSREQVEEELLLTTPHAALPEQAEHLVTSNSVTTEADCIISTKMVQADPYEAALPEGGFKPLTVDDKKAIKAEGFPEMRITTIETGYIVSRPPFGSGYAIRQHPLRSAGKLSPAFRFQSTVKTIKGIIMRVQREAIGVATPRECMSCAVDAVNKLMEADQLKIDDEILILLRFSFLTNDKDLMNCLLQLACVDQKQLITRIIRDGENRLLKAVLASKHPVDKSEIMPGKPVFDVNLNLTPSGNTPLYYAVVNGNLEAVNLLLAHGANPNQLLQSGMGPLHFAASQGNTAMVETLLSAGANPNVAVAFNGKTPLHYAAKKNRTDVVRLLLDAGANVFMLDGSQKTAYQLAEKAGYTACAKQIEKGLIASATKIRSTLFARYDVSMLKPSSIPHAQEPEDGVDDAVGPPSVC